MTDSDREQYVSLVRGQWLRVDSRYQDHFEQSGRQPDCVGCHKAYCCRQLVLSTEAEARIIRDFVSRWPRRKQQALARRLQALPNAARENFSDPCPFLVEERCQVYSVRPLACRAFHSMNKSRCKRRLKAVDPALFSELSEYNRELRQRLAQSEDGSDVVATAIWMKYHWLS